MTDREKIKAEIKRLMGYCPKHATFGEKLLSFIDSLLEEPVSEDEEEAAERYCDTEHPYVTAARIPLINAFKAGAKWQKEQIAEEFDKETIDEMVEERAEHCGNPCTLYFEGSVKNYRKGIEDTLKKIKKG